MENTMLFKNQENQHENIGKNYNLKLYKLFLK